MAHHCASRRSRYHGHFLTHRLDLLPHDGSELDHYVLRRPHGFSSLEVAGVARQAWRAIVEEIVAAGHLTQAQHVFRLLSQMFNFGVELGALQASPFHGLRARTLGAVPVPPRQRTLDVDELRAVLKLLDAPCPVDARPGRFALKILLLTGKRTSELLKARWPEVDLDAATWRIPAGNRKGKMHAAIGDEVVPLSAAAVAAFKELRDLARGSEWVVASPHRNASSRGHMRETALNKTVYWLLKKGRLEMPRWTPHDARRTARSYWSERLGKAEVAGPARGTWLSPAPPACPGASRLAPGARGPGGKPA